jgi:hypothetical protein
MLDETTGALNSAACPILMSAIWYQWLKSSTPPPPPLLGCGLQANWLSNRVFADYKDIIVAACEAWNKLTAPPAVITSIGSVNGLISVKPSCRWYYWRTKRRAGSVPLVSQCGTQRKWGFAPTEVTEILIR